MRQEIVLTGEEFGECRCKYLSFAAAPDCN